MARVYLDANIFIRMFEGDEGDEISSLLMRLPDVGWNVAYFATSELSLAEVLVRPYREHESALVERYDAALRAGSWLDVAPVARDVLAGAAVLRARWRTLKLPDAIHIATAALLRCDAILTGDLRITGTYDLAHEKGGVWHGSAAVRVLRPLPEVLKAIVDELSA